jgi:lactoylglutathione lyase
MVLGTVEGTAFGSLSMLQLPGDPFVTIELVHDPARAEADIGTGINHLVVQVESLDAALADLAAKGITSGVPELPGGADGPQTSWITDPDGYRIELVQDVNGQAPLAAGRLLPHVLPGRGGQDRRRRMDALGVEHDQGRVGPAALLLLRGGGPGPGIDQHSALRYLIEPDGAPSGPWIVSREGAVTPFIAHDGAGEALIAGGCAQYRDVG